jgi:alpha-methylacyl-CoA racemase
MSGPLAGVRVLDFTRLLPGPFGTMILADLGADVVRVEAVGLPDLLMVMPPMDGKCSAGHRSLNRNKRSIIVDLKNPAGAGVVARLVPRFDVLVEQFRPGVMDRLGVGYPALAAANPGLIYCSITGYGQDGPYRDRAGHDLNYLALAGVLGFTGRREAGPLPLGIQVADQCAGGMNAVVAILAALVHKARTGQGQRIDISMTDGAMHLAALYAGNYLAGGAENCREGDVLNGGSYYDVYPTKDGKYLAVAGLEPQFFKAMCTALGREDLLSYHLAVGKRNEHLKAELRAEFLKKTRAEWEEIFARTDACVEPVLSIAEMTAHPLAAARGMVVEVPSESGQALRQIGSPYKMDQTPAEFRHAGVTPGTNTAEVLGAAGFSADEIQQLKAQGAVK